MPNVLLNLWACNTMSKDPSREAALDLPACGDDWGKTADQIIAEVEDPETLSTSEQGSPFGAAEWHASLTADWPELGPVIDPSEFISQASEDAREHWRNYWWNKQPDDIIHCFDYAAYQLVVKDFFTTDWLPDTTTYQVYRDDSGLNINETVEGVRYLKQALAADIPVLVGIKIASFDYKKNMDRTTGHYVVVVGMGVDGDGHYFHYYDGRNTSDGEKFYLKPDLEIGNLNGRARVAHIRQTISL